MQKKKKKSQERLPARRTLLFRASAVGPGGLHVGKRACAILQLSSRKRGKKRLMRLGNPRECNITVGKLKKGGHVIKNRSARREEVGRISTLFYAWLQLFSMKEGSEREGSTSSQGILV